MQYCKCGKGVKYLRKGLCGRCAMAKKRADDLAYRENEKKKDLIRYHTKIGNKEKVDELNGKRCVCGKDLINGNKKCIDCINKEKRLEINKRLETEENPTFGSPAKNLQVEVIPAEPINKVNVIHKGYKGKGYDNGTYRKY